MEKFRKVRIKTWEEMRKEFGVLTDDGVIYIPLDDAAFTKRMDELLPEDRIIEINDDYFFEGWIITDGMIAEYFVNSKFSIGFIDHTTSTLTCVGDIEETPPQLSKDYYYNNLGKFELCTRKAHQTHYIKWKLTDNLSIRYFYSFQDNPDFIGKFVFKNHNKKESVVVSKDTAKELLEFVKEDFEEIIGYYSEKDEYKKLVLVGGDIKNISVLINDKVAL